jgi:hypothetical protein
LKLVIIPVGCVDCGHENKVEVNTFTWEVKILPTKPKSGWTFKQKWEIVWRYKELKGYTPQNMPGFDKVYKPRAMKAAGGLLDFFGPMQGDPVVLSIECMEDVARTASKEGWNWEIETVVKRAKDWLAAKQQPGRTR